MLRALRSALASRLTPWLLLALTLAGGAAFGLRTAWREVPSPEVVDLASRVRARGREYGRGLALIASGSVVVGKDLLVSATDRMALVVEECAQAPGCDIGLVVAELSTVLDEQRMAIAAAGNARGRGDVAPNAVPVLHTHHSPFPAALPEVTRAASLLRGVDLEVLVGYNRRVKRALNDWLTWNRPQLVDAYESYLFLRKQLAPIYAEAGLPEALLFGLLAQETGGKVHAYSSAGAAGSIFGMAPMRSESALFPPAVIGSSGRASREDARRPRPSRSGSRRACRSTPAPAPRGRAGRATPRWPAPCPGWPRSAGPPPPPATRTRSPA